MEMIYMEQAFCFRHSSLPTHISQQPKSLYELKQEPIKWFDESTSICNTC